MTHETTPNNSPTPKRVEFGIGYACNNDCRFCSEHYNRTSNRLRDMLSIPAERIKEQIRDAFESGARHITFLGGEPTVHKRFLELVAFAKSVGFEEIYITTNGRKFADANFAQQAMDAGLTRITFSLHGHNEQLHNHITQTNGAFEQTIEGMENVRSLGVPFDITTVICKSNMTSLADIYRFERSLSPRRIMWALVRPIGAAFDNFDEIVPRLSDLKEPLHEALSLAQTDKAALTVANVPMCILTPFIGFADEIYWQEDSAILREIRKFAAVHGMQITHASYRVNREHYKVKPRICAKCAYIGVCAGLFKEYFERRGADELAPIEGEKVRSFVEIRLPHIERETKNAI